MKQNNKITKTINISFIILSSILIATGSFLVYNSVSNYKQFIKTKQTTKLIEEISVLVHELQKERGYSSAFMSNESGKFKDELITQKEKTNDANTKVEQILTTIKSDNYDGIVYENLELSYKIMDSLENYRNNISARVITSEEAIRFYSQLNKQLLKTIDALLQQNDDIEIIQISQSVLFFMRMKEYAGIERAVLSRVFSVDSFPDNYFQKFSILVENQNNFEELFLQYANETETNFYNQKRKDNSFNEVKEYRNIALLKYKATHVRLDKGDYQRLLVASVDACRS